MAAVYVPYCTDKTASEELLASHRTYLFVSLRGTISLVPRPHPLMRRNDLNQVEFGQSLVPKLVSASSP